LEDCDSIVNQEIKRKFVAREVLGHFTTEVRYILSRDDDPDAPFSYDDIEHFYRPYCRECGEGYASFTLSENEAGEITHTCNDCQRQYSQCDYDRLDCQPAEVYEWWAVSSFLADKLSAHGECIIDRHTPYWGRRSTGQAILLDGVISEICEEMGILDGQANSWRHAAN